MLHCSQTIRHFAFTGVYETSHECSHKKATRVSVVSCIMYDGSPSACQDWEPEQWIQGAGGHCRREAGLDSSLVIISLMLSHFDSKTQFFSHHVVLIGWGLTFAWFLPLHCCRHIIMNTLFFCFWCKILMSSVMETGRWCDWLSGHSLCASKAREEPKKTTKLRRMEMYQKQNEWVCH